MPAPESTPGAPCWIDLMTSGIARARQFYGELFGWEYETGDEEKYGGYTTARKNGKTVAYVWSTAGDVKVSLRPGETAKQMGTPSPTAATGSAVIGSTPVQVVSDRTAAELVGAL